MKKLIFVKLGGSLISDKTKINQARFDEISRLSMQIKDLKEEYSLVIFTGAGGFGHPVAEKYKNNLKEGVKEIKRACKEINKIVVNSLKDLGLKAISVEPDKIAEFNDGKIISLTYDLIVQLLERDVIPVFHADLVNDKRSGILVLSMDKFLVDLAIYLSRNDKYVVEKAIFVGTTSGVFDKKSKVIPTITKKNYSTIKGIFYKNKGIDVSGGMKYKVEQCLRLAENGIDSYITGDLFKRGTVITKE